MEDLILALEPAFHRVEKFLLWKNRYASILVLALGHGIFYGIARVGLRPFCAIMIVLFLLHFIDCIRKKQLINEELNLSELTKLILQCYRTVCRTQEKLQTMKTENRMKYSLMIIFIALLMAYIGMKINGFYVSYIVMLILFTLPAMMYHRILRKLLKRLAPILEQLDQSMEYKRRTLIDRKDLLVKVKTPGLNQNDDEEEEIDLSNSSFDVLTDSSTEDETVRLSELSARVGDQIDGKHRIKIKGDEIKIKGRSTIIEQKFSPNQNLSGTTEPDLSSFDFLNEYDQ